MKLEQKTLDEIINKLGREYVLEKEPMKFHSHMEVGGPCEYLIVPGNSEELIFVITKLKEADYPYYVIGKGSNIIFRDEGYEGAIIKILERFSYIEVQGDRVKAGAGALNKDISDALIKEGLSGFEFASGIPGCIGGGITMNAGAYDGELKDIVESVTVLTKDGRIKVFSNEDMGFGYRKSNVRPQGYIVLEATLKLKKDSAEAVGARVDELTRRREEKQPLEYPSCGSVFKRPEGHFAGGLISDSGLKGMQIGGAQVSEKHAGFIVNRGGATAKDVFDLIEYIQKKVYEDSGVMLEPEAIVL